MGIKFTRSIEEEFLRLGAKTSKVVTRAAKQAWKRAVKETPYDTRTARNGWKLSRTRRSSYVPVVRRQPEPRVPKFRFRATKDKRVYLYNNVEYISILDKGAVGRRGNFMMRKAMTVFERELRLGFSNIKR